MGLSRGPSKAMCLVARWCLILGCAWGAFGLWCYSIVFVFALLCLLCLGCGVVVLGCGCVCVFGSCWSLELRVSGTGWSLELNGQKRQLVS